MKLRNLHENAPETEIVDYDKINKEKRLTSSKFERFGTPLYTSPEMIPPLTRLDFAIKKLTQAKKRGDIKAIEKFNKMINDASRQLDDWHKHDSKELDLAAIPFPWDPHERMILDPETMIVLMLKNQNKINSLTENLITTMLMKYLRKLETTRGIKISQKDIRNALQRLVDRGVIAKHSKNPNRYVLADERN